MRVVLDTSVLIAALRSNKGAASEVFRLILHGRITLLMSLALSLEFRAVALREKHQLAVKRGGEEIIFLHEQLDAIAEPIQIYFSYRPLSSDPNDDLVLELAINGMADCIVTFNRKHFSPAVERFGLDSLTPSEFLETRYAG